MQTSSLRFTRGIAWVGLVALGALAYNLIGIGPVWGQAEGSGSLNVGCFVLLFAVGFEAARRADRLAARLTTSDEAWLRTHRGERDLLPRRARQIREERIAAVEGTPAAPLAPAHDAQSLFEGLVDEVHLRYVAGDALAVRDLRDIANDRNLERLASFTSLMQRALALGFLGTLVGVIAQVMGSERQGLDGLLDTSFLGGTLLAATTTLQGVVTAAFSFWLRDRLLRSMDRQLEEALPLLGVDLLARLGDDRTRAALEIAEILKNATAEMETRLVETSLQIGRAVREAFSGASDAMASALRDAVKDELGAPITTALDALASGVAASVSALSGSIDRSDRVLASASATLTTAANAIRDELSAAVRTPGELTAALQQSRHALAQVAGDFQRITGELREAGAVLRRSDDELLARAHAHEVRADQAAAQQREAAQHLNQTMARFEASVDYLARVVNVLIGQRAPAAEGDDLDADPPHAAGSTNGRGWP
jgi:hypothetical protein